MASESLVFHHLGLVVSDIAEARVRLEATLGLSDWSKVFSDPIQKVDVQFGKDAGGLRYELISPNAEGAPVASVLKTKKNVLNHVAYTAKDLELAGQHFRNVGNIPLSAPAPAVAFDGAKIQFWYCPDHYIIELIEQSGGSAD